MNAASGPPAADGDSTAPAWKRLALVASIVPLAALIAISGLDVVFPGRVYVVIHCVIEIAVVVVCFATFAVQWYAVSARTGDARGRVIGAAFLGIGILETAHLLSFPGMTAFGTGSTGRGIWYWLAARIGTVAALVVAALVQPASQRWLLRRRALLAAVLGVSVALIVIEARTPAAASLFFVPGQGLTPLKKVLELTVMGVAGFTALLYWRLHRTTNDWAPRRIAAALALTAVSELCFTMYASAYDAFNLLGHVYLALAFYLIFDALFVSALLQPYRDLRATSRELEAANGELSRLRKHVESELAVTIARLQQTQQLQDDLVRAVTHDVRTPLQVIALQAEVLRRSAKEAPGSVMRGADTIIDSTHRIEAMLRDLVDAAHLERGGVRLVAEPVRVSDLVTRLLAGSAGVVDPARVSVEIPDELPPVEADPSRLERIVANLIGNAIKYSGPEADVRVLASVSGDDLQIAVADRGPGIEPDDLSRIFDRFYRGRSATGDGLGLGLHIVKLLARAHGGDVRVESQIGRGTTFTVTLPLRRPSASA